jgi:EAL domain-containing protein (putative c-di-GMP-specific phosphodiesterase class I)
MRSKTNSGAWRKQLRVLSLMPVPDRLLKYFPPGFVLRDPVYRMVERTKRNGGQVALLLFHLEDYHTQLKSKPAAFIRMLQKQIHKHFLEVATSFITKEDMIGVKQMHSDEISLFIRIESPEGFGRCSVVAGKIREELELRLERLFSLHMETSLRIRTGCSLVENHDDTDFAIESAYHFAMAVAAKNLPAHFAMQHLQLEEIIRLENLAVLTQPIMDLRSGEVFGWEVLTRGPKNSPFHNPVELFEFADQAELLPDLEWVVIQKALREVTERQIKEQVFINITPVSLSEPSLLGRILEQLKHSALDSSQIIFEITERHSINDFDQMASILRSYRAQGFRFAVDDAGSGYSSLQSMSELIPDIIKIDKSVIRNIDREAVKQAMLRSLLYFAENINCTVIAEGVEREEEANILLQNKVHMGQGYYFAKPQPFEHGRNVVHFASLKEKIIHMRKAASGQ